MLRIKLIVQSLKAKVYFTFAFLCILVTVSAQSPFVDSIIFYNAKNTISIFFQQDIYSSIDKPWSRSGEINIYKAKGETYYSVFEKTNREIVKSAKYSGYNAFIDSSFVDYSTYHEELLEEITGYAFYVFYPHEVNYFFKHPLEYDVKTDESSTHYFIEIRLKKPKYTSDGIGFIKAMTDKFVIQTQGYKIESYRSYSDMSINGIEMTDSIISKYNYQTANEEEVLRKIEKFKPFPKKENFGDLGKKVMDTATVFPSFNLPDINSIMYNSDNCKSRYVLVEFWYKSCAPCLTNINELKKIRNNFTKEQVELLAINDGDAISKDMAAFLNKYDLNYTVLFNGKLLSWQQLQVRAHPNTYIFDRATKKIIFHKVGSYAGYANEITHFLQDALKN